MSHVGVLGIQTRHVITLIKACKPNKFKINLACHAFKKPTFVFSSRPCSSGSPIVSSRRKTSRRLPVTLSWTKYRSCCGRQISGLGSLRWRIVKGFFEIQLKRYAFQKPTFVYSSTQCSSASPNVSSQRMMLFLSPTTLGWKKCRSCNGLQISVQGILRWRNVNDFFETLLIRY